MKTTGLSLDQAPPIIIPFKFFLTASLFSVIVGIVLMIEAEAVFLSRWSPLALGISVPQKAAGEMRECGPSSSACRCW